MLLFCVYGCGAQNEKSLDNFNMRVFEVLRNQNFVKAKIDDLTDFQWDKLCFHRKNKLSLVFYSNRDEFEFKFNYEKYFVDEPYVDRSLAGKCISNKDFVIIKRKYPGYSETIEFQAAN